MRTRKAVSSTLDVFDGLTRLFAVGAVVVDRIRRIGVAVLGRERQHGVLTVDRVMEPLVLGPVDHGDDPTLGVARETGGDHLP